MIMGIARCYAKVLMQGWPLMEGRPHVAGRPLVTIDFESLGTSNSHSKAEHKCSRPNCVLGMFT